MGNNSIFNVLERRSERGFFPLNENHWSNVLAWFLTLPATRNSLLELLSPGVANSEWKVEREVEYLIGSRRRLIDIHLTSYDGIRVFIEVKIDPCYQDREQIADQLSLLHVADRFCVVSPLDLSSLLSSIHPTHNSILNKHALTWRSISNWSRSTLLNNNDLGATEQSLLREMELYWEKSTSTPFELMVEKILDEKNWDTFYPDDFKEEFVKRFPDIWASWVAEKPSTGNGNPHQYLLQCLSGLTKRKYGFRLEKTGLTRPPRPSDWGYQMIFEYRCVSSGAQMESN